MTGFQRILVSGERRKTVMSLFFSAVRPPKPREDSRPPHFFSFAHIFLLPFKGTDQVKISCNQGREIYKSQSLTHNQCQRKCRKHILIMCKRSNIEVLSHFHETHWNPFLLSLPPCFHQPRTTHSASLPTYYSIIPSSSLP